jgi:predicted nuclease of predicted toxin-antitoxin system
MAQWEFVCREGRVMVTHDTDFLSLAGTTTDHPGVIYCQMDHSIGQLVRGLIQFYETRAAVEMIGRVEFL